MKVINLIYGILLVVMPSHLFSQKAAVLTLDEAVSLAVQNNFNVRIARNEAMIDKTNNTAGNAGMLPEVALNFGTTSNINNTKQEFFSGDTRQGSGVNTSNINANVLLGWTVFDGMRMFVTRDRLREIEQTGQLNLQLQIEQTIYQVISAYYSIEQQKKRISTIEKAIEISIERKQLAELKLSVGTGSAVPVLQARVDINADSASLVRQLWMLKNSRVMLNEIIGRTPETDFETESYDSEKEQIPDYATLAEKVQNRNSLIMMAERNIRLAELNIKQWESNRYPSLDLNLGYNFNRSKAEIGILKFNQNNGVSYGLTGRWNLFNGYNNKREIQVAKLGMETTKLAHEQMLQSVSTDLFTFYNNYTAARDLSRFEDANIKVAEQNLAITTEKMRVGTIDALELRQAQLNLVDAEFRKIASDFEARMAWLEIRRLTGEFLKN